jgi:hypothetical protein
MSESITLTIQLSQADCDRLQSEAKRLNIPPEALASIVLQFGLAKINPSIDGLAALWGLSEIRKKLPPIDAVKLARESREELEQRGVF